MRAKILITLIAVGVLSALAAGVFFFSNGVVPADENVDAQGIVQETESEPLPTNPETRQVYEDWRGYENASYRFGLLYPQELRVHEYKESDGAMSAVFEDPRDGRGFQIYVTPYSGTQITKERFLLDVSSGVMLEPTDVLISGVRGTMFFSKNSVMGETREVWFIRGGFLYEVVTYKQLDAWLAGIMQTWKFKI